MTRWTTLALALLLAACGAAMPKGQAEKLQEAVYEYNRALRWGNIDTAAAYLPAAERPAFLREHKGDSTIIMGADVLAVEPDYEHDLAEVTVAYEWRSPTGITVNLTRMRQIWRYTDGAWLLASRQEVKGEPDKNRDPASRF